MADITRRAALKYIAGGAGTLLPVSTVLAGADCSQSGLSQAATRSVNNTQTPLKIEIVTGKSIPEDTVLLSSSVSHSLMIHQFLPGMLAFDDRLLDLNQLFNAGPITIQPNIEYSASLHEWQLLADPNMREYLHADTAAQSIGTGTRLLALDALVDTKGTAVVYISESVGSEGFA